MLLNGLRIVQSHQKRLNFKINETLLNQKAIMQSLIKDIFNKYNFFANINIIFIKLLDKQELKLSKKLISNYKKKLEKEIFERSMKLKMPQSKFEEIINNNNELINLRKALEELDTNSESSNQI